MAPVDPEKLKALQARGTVQRVGGKRISRPKAAVKNIAIDDKRVKTTIAKLGARDVPDIDEINMFKTDGTVLTFANPKLTTAIQNNVYSITGVPQHKQLADMLPDIVTQMGFEGLEYLKEMYGEGEGEGEGKTIAEPTTQ